MIAVLETGANLASVKNALARLGAEVEFTLSPKRIRKASHVILPGVGSAGASMARLNSESGLVSVLRELTQPVLGICLGMQLLFERSEEANVPCLGILPGEVRLLRRVGLSVPHMGWNQLVRSSRHFETFLLEGISEEAYFYFVHSYEAPSGDFVSEYCEYGGYIPAIVQRKNFVGVQFHPERSATAGARLLKNFLGPAL